MPSQTQNMAFWRAKVWLLGTFIPAEVNMNHSPHHPTFRNTALRGPGVQCGPLKAAKEPHAS